MKLRKRFAAMGAAMVMAVSMMSVGANAAHYQERTGSLSGATVKGSSSVTSITGASSTSIAANVVASVTGTYSWVNTSTLATGTTTQSKGYMYSATVNFNAPSGCRSVREVGSHSVSYSGQSWSASTTAIY